MFLLTSASLDRANQLFTHLIVRPAVLLNRFDDSLQYTMAEAVQTWITPRAGRGAASELIKDAIKKAPQGSSFKQAILADAKLLELIGPTNLDKVFAPANYLGHAPLMVGQAVARVRLSFR